MTLVNIFLVTNILIKRQKHHESFLDLCANAYACVFAEIKYTVVCTCEHAQETKRRGREEKHVFKFSPLLIDHLPADQIGRQVLPNLF